MKKKRKSTPRQLHELKEGRKKLAMNELRRNGVNPFPKPKIIRQVVKQPVHTTFMTPNQKGPIKFAIFNNLISTNFFPIQIGKKTQKYNIKQLISYFLKRFNFHWSKIQENRKEIENLKREIKKMKKNKSNSDPHFMKQIDYSKNEPWRSDFILGQKGSKNHGHLALSGASIYHARDEEGNEIIKEGKIIDEKKK